MNIAQRFNEEFQKALEEKLFPFEILTLDWINAADKALRFASPLSMGIAPEGLKKLVTDFQSGKLTYYQFALISNTLESRSSKDLEMPLNDYADMITAAGEFSKKWNEDTKVIRDDISKQLAEEEQMKKVASGDAGPGREPMRAVKAEA